MTTPLNQALELVDEGQLGPLASSIAQGRVFGIRPAPDAAPCWLLDPAPDDAPGACKLWRIGDDRIHFGRRADLLIAVTRRLRDALRPYEGQGDVPAWVAVARIADVQLRAATSPATSAATTP